MMDNDVQRPSFSELNRVLEDKVKNLMADLDSILIKQTDAIQLPKQHRQQKLEATSKHIIDDYHSHQVGWLDDAQEPQQKPPRAAAEPLVRFFKGQITKLQSDLQALHYDKKKMEGQCKHLQAQVRKKEENEEKILNQQNSYRDSIVKLESANSDMGLKIQAQNTHIVSLQKEIDSLKTKLMALQQLSSNNELRLNRNLQENEKLRSSLKINQTQEKESREYIRKIQEEKRLALKASEKQRTDILQAFKKQIQLANNLKKQNLYIETNKQLTFIEQEFEKILEWKDA